MRDREREELSRCGWWGQAPLCFCNLSQIYVYTFTNEKSRSATSVFIFTHAHGSLPGAAAPSGSRLLKQLFRWMIKVKAQPAWVSPLLFKEEWDSCHLLMHCPPSGMQTRHPHSTGFLPAPLSLPSSPMGPQRVASGDWSGAMASLETCVKSAHPASQAQTLRHADLMWSVR